MAPKCQSLTDCAVPVNKGRPTGEVSVEPDLTYSSYWTREYQDIIIDLQFFVDVQVYMFNVQR